MYDVFFAQSARNYGIFQVSCCSMFEMIFLVFWKKELNFHVHFFCRYSASNGHWFKLALWPLEAVLCYFRNSCPFLNKSTEVEIFNCYFGANKIVLLLSKWGFQHKNWLTANGYETSCVQNLAKHHSQTNSDF